MTVKTKTRWKNVPVIDEVHKELFKIQSEIKPKDGKSPGLGRVVKTLVDEHNQKKR